MNFGRNISLVTLLGALLLGFAFPLETSAQSRLVHVPGTEKKDLTHEMPLRAVQSGSRSIKSLGDPCAPSSSVKIKKQSSSTTVGALYVGGERSPDCIFSDLVKITFLNSLGKKARCTGILLSSNLVLTAGHCTCGKLGSYRIHRRKDRLFYKKKNKAHENEYVLMAPPARYNNYSCGPSPELQPGRDLAVLSIDNRRDFQRRKPEQGIRKREKPTRGVYIADMATIYNDKDRPQLLIGAGYGQMDDGTLPDHLRYAAVPIASFFCGQNRLAGSNCRAMREFVLADRLSSSGQQRGDSCNGDSGGPIFYQAPQRLLSNQENVDETVPNVKNIVMLVGIASRALRGVRHNRGTLCGGGGIYTAVGHPDVIAWLRTFGVNPLNVFNYDFRRSKP